jgi:4-amino-4-deoxy-L-arabinose transferase-like glycosyltransferase
MQYAEEQRLSSDIRLPVRDRALLSWLPFLWSDVLFPGRRAADATLRWPALLLLVLIPGALLYPCLSFHLFEPDEGRYAEIAREMLVRGEWVIPYLQGEPYLDKPPLLYWLVMASYRLFGVHDGSARLVPALAVHGCVLLTYLLGRRTLGERAAFWGALFLGLAPGFVSVGRLLVLDGLLTFWVWLSVLAAFEAVRGLRLARGWWLLAAAATGLGILTKGPVVLVLLVPPLVLHRVLCGSRWRLGWRPVLAFAAVVAALCLPWYVAASVRMPGFLRYFFWEHNLVRFVAPFDHERPIWFYGPIVLGGLIPGTFVTVGFVRFLLSGDAVTAERRSPELGFMLAAGCWCVFFFSLSGCKLPTYVLPAFPPLALALGSFMSQSSWERSRWTPRVMGTVLVLLAAVHYVAIPWYARHHSPMSRPAAVREYCGDPETPVVCYPRHCDSVAFYLGRDDFLSYRSKETPEMIRFLLDQPRAVILFTHRHSLAALREVLPPELRVAKETVLFGSARPGPEGDCHMALIESLKHARR